MAKILVTGGSGFVGSNLIDRLLRDGHEITSVDDYSNGLKENNLEGVKYLQCDLSKSESLRAITSVDFDAVYHLAAQSSNAISMKYPARDLLTNQLATLNLIDFCSVNKISRVIFTSSMSVYGNQSVFPTSSEEAPKPETFYAIHKAASERYFQISREIDWTIFRLYTTYGAGQNLSNLEQGLVKIFLGFILRNEPIKIHGSINRIRDIIHVSDVVEALAKSLFETKTHRQIYNLGSGKTISVHQLIVEILRECGKPEDYPVIIEEGDSGDPIKTHADIDLTRKALDWSPKVTPSEGIALTVSKYKDELGTNKNYR